ncbi:hypothetical protein BC936DRAFT_145149 [Jimgerdemannia flammicorona]|uniref:Uncharacterized protein n=1 Tax=Jimgerdemannia flammicorona TaxID=994334 RepID=A0A433DAT9_9FUNG|nr:hypothetical protein BC936DRAFT_145149 [Jimgerdemannia flammicorona]
MSIRHRSSGQTADYRPDARQISDADFPRMRPRRARRRARSHGSRAYRVLEAERKHQPAHAEGSAEAQGRIGGGGAAGSGKRKGRGKCGDGGGEGW